MSSLNAAFGPATERRLEWMDDETLTPVVRAVFDDGTATVDEYSRTHLHAGVGGGRGGTMLFRIEGTATTRTGEREWSVVLKILAEYPGDDPADRRYWRREAEVYESNLLDDVPGNLVPVHAYRVDEYPGESVWLWLEDLEDDYSGQWPLAQYRRAARHLGEFNGAFLAGRKLPEAPWLPERPRPFNVSGASDVVTLVDRVPDDPMVRRHFPTEEDHDRLFATWSKRDQFRAAREALPPTFCHFDAFGRNLFTTLQEGTRRTVAIDWDLCGPGRIGDDAGALVFLTLAFLDWPVARADALERAVLEGYREGLAAVGWDGPIDDVLRGYRLHVVDRWLRWVDAVIRASIDERSHDLFTHLLGAPIDAIVASLRRVHRFVFDTVEALGLGSSGNSTGPVSG